MTQESGISPNSTLPGVSSQEQQLIVALRDRQEAAFEELLKRYHSPLLSLARFYVRDQGMAEEVVQDTWRAVLGGIDRFEGRSSLKTWISRILVNQAKTRARREGRTIAFSDLVGREVAPGEMAVDPERFQGPNGDYPGHWSVSPRLWSRDGEELLLSKEALDQVGQAIRSLPPVQQRVITLRDVEGWTSQEVCNVLEISETNQRVLLHRARSRVRGALEEYFGVGGG